MKKIKDSGEIILSHFISDSLSNNEKAVCGYIRLLALHNLPTHLVEEQDLRKLTRFSARIFQTNVTKIIL